MAADDAGDEQPGFGGEPLPPDDRLWRHPSELGLDRPATSATGVAPSPRRPALWTVALVASLAGATLSTGVIAATATLDRRVVDRPVVEKVALTPVVSSPMIAKDAGLAAVVERLSPAIVHLEVIRVGGPSTGSGVVYRDDGLVLASAHVVEGATKINVDLADGRRLTGRLVGLDALTGVALVDLDGGDFPVATLGSAAGLRVGSTTVAIGSPRRPDATRAVTAGIVSSLDQRVLSVHGQPLHGMIQIDEPTEPAWSGGALIDEYGAVVGILTAVANDAPARFGFATPIDLARRIADQLLEEGRVTHCWLGVEGGDLSAEQANLLGLASGTIVQRVAGGSPAERAGLSADDVITEMDGEVIRSASHLVLALRSRTPGDRVVVGYWRAGEHAEARVTLVARP